MTNAEKFQAIFGRYATEMWALPEEEFLKWLNDGAQPTDTVKNLLSEKGIMKKFAEAKDAK